MGILQLPTALTGQIGINPVTKKMVVTNTLSEVTTPGFLNAGNLQGFTVSTTDIIEVTYDANILTKSGQVALLTVSISNGIITLGKPSNDPTSATIFSFDVTVTFSQLAGLGSAVLYQGSGGNQYKVRALWTNLQGANFAGGDRDAFIYENGVGGFDYARIPAAGLQTLANRTWGNANLAFSTGLSLNTTTEAGASLKIAYVAGSGTTDYTSGSFTVSGLLQRVA